jgi:1,4-dihydroxy-2-naphthoate octaprenyltransferase
MSFRSAPNPWLLAVRPRTLFAAVAPVVIGSALAAHHLAAYGLHFQPLPALLCAGFALLAQIGANFANDYFDHRRGADAPGRLGPTRTVAAGLISPTAMLGAALLALALAAGVGCGLIAYGGRPTIVIGVASLLCALAYTGGPFPLAYHGLGEVCVLVFFGFVAVLGTYGVQAGWPAPPAAWLAAAACGLLAVNILLVNNIRDLATDTRAGKRTLVVRLGRRFAQRFFISNIIFALLTPVVFFALQTGPAVLLPLVLSPVGILLARVLAATPDDDGPRFNKLLAQAAQFLALWAAFLAVGLMF